MARRSRKVSGVELSFHEQGSSYDSDASDLEDRLSSSFSNHGMRKRPGQGKIGEPTLHQCSRNNDLEGLQRLLRSKDILRNINSLDQNGMSALHYASRFNNYQAVKIIIEDGKADSMIEDTDKATPLHYCARKRQQEDTKDAVEIIKFLARLADVNSRDRYQSTPLHFAAIRGNLVAARTLVNCSREILINAKDALGCTPLHDAATYGRTDVAELLINNGARLLHTDNDKCTALHLACVEGKPDIVKLFLNACDDKHRVQLINRCDDDDNTALHYAVESRSLECVRILLENGADINKVCRLRSSGDTPLHLAAIEDVPDIGKLLLDHGADISAKDNNYATPLHKAGEYMCPKMTKILLSNVKVDIDVRDKDFYTPLLCAVCYSNTEVVRLLLEENADTTLTQSSERNIIHMATECQQESVLQLLLSTLKNDCYELINAADRYGDTPLHLAAQTGNINIVKMLIKYGADLSCKNEDEETAMLIACKHGHYRIVQCMLENEEKVLNDEDECSNSSLHVASAKGHTEVVKLLCEWGAEKNDKNTTYQCPIDLAAERGHEEIVRYLLEQDIMPDPIDKEKDSPLQLACTNGHEKVVEVLIERGADVTRVNSEKKNCLMIAIDKGHREVVASILKSSKWQEALACERRYDNQNVRDTPLRQLIKKMPDMLNLALDHFVSRGPDEDSKYMQDSDFYIQFHLELLDDTYLPDYDNRLAIFKDVKGEIHSDENLPQKDIRPYSKDLNWVKYNHPLMLMVEKKEAKMLDHPVVLALIRHKWEIGRKFYFLFVLYYALFVAVYTALMIEDDPPYFFRNCTEYEPHSFEGGKILIFILAGIGSTIEVFQFFATWLLYFSDPVNFLDIFCYLSSMITVIDVSCNGMRAEWQWQLSAFTMLSIWLNFLLFFRRFPAVGIYVVMITDILKTFMKFFVIFFLFIIAFGLSFYMLLQNQEVFSTPEQSIMKTFVMMLGELEYSSTFFPEQADEAPPYYGVTIAVFVIFLVLIAVILMNLLVGLAVEDVNQLRQHAMLVKLRMQIDLALDVEMALPEWLKRFFMCNKKYEQIFPNVYEGWISKFSKKVNKFIEGPLLAEDTILDAVKCLDEEELPSLNVVQKRIASRMDRNEDFLREVNDRLMRIEKILIESVKTNDT